MRLEAGGSNYRGLACHRSYRRSPCPGVEPGEICWAGDGEQPGTPTGSNLWFLTLPVPA